MIVLAAVLGAMVYAILHEWIEWRIRVRERQAACYHDFYEIKDPYGYGTNVCRKCKFQEPIKRNDASI